MIKTRNLCLCFSIIFMASLFPASTRAQDENEAFRLEPITVTAAKKEKAVAIPPQRTIIDVEEFKTPGTPQNIVDILKDQAIIDFRGESDLVPTRDEIRMRGFDTHRFTIAMDGLTIDYGRNAFSGSRSMVVNPATLPLGEIERIEIIPGPHSALYGGKSEGGVVNLITKKPKRSTALKPDFRVTTGYRSYNTQNFSLNANGGVGSFSYGFGVQHYHTDGYLRNNESDINNFSAQMAYILPSDGYIRFDTAYTDLDRELTVNNGFGNADYDNGYPETPTARYWPWQKPGREEKYHIHRLRYVQPSPIGLLTICGYLGGDTMDIEYLKKKGAPQSPQVKPDEIERYLGYTETEQRGGKIENEFELFDNHTMTLGVDFLQIRRPNGSKYANNYTTPSHKQADLRSCYFQDKWDMTPRLTWMAGARYEAVEYWRHNWAMAQNKPAVPTEGVLIHRDWNQLVPKSFLTYALDDLSDLMRDTSISLGISKIWNPLPFCYG